MNKEAVISTALKRPLPIRLWNIITKNRNLSKLDPDILIKKARQQTGITKLGADFDITPMKILCTSIEEEARLNPFGRFMISKKLINQVIGRLWTTYWLEKYPEILEQEVYPIVLITGLQRTGTTRLQRSLSNVQGARPLMSWEALNPAPIGRSNEKKKRIKSTKLNERAVKYIAPGFHTIHPIYHDAPEEDVLLLDLAFMSTTSEAIMNVPSYSHWIEQNDQTPAYEYEYKLLKLLQWQKDGKFWVLKSPHHLEFIDEHNLVFPNKKLVWTHRDPQKCIPSFLSMVYHSHAMFTDHPSVEGIRNHWLRKTHKMVEKGMKLEGKEIINVSYNEILNNDRQIAEKITGKAPPLTESRNYNSKHSYTLADFGITEEEIYSRFQHYYKFAKQNKIAL